MKAELRVNGEPRAIEADGDTPLPWVLRDHLRMTGTKFGCGIGQCGACTVHTNGVATRSCLVPFASTIGTSIKTIDGLSRNGTQTLQRAWLEDNVPQCGYCQSGMLMAAAALLHQHDSPTDQQINSSTDQHLSVRHVSTRSRSHPQRSRQDARRSKSHCFFDFDRPLGSNSEDRSGAESGGIRNGGAV